MIRRSDCNLENVRKITGLKSKKFFKRSTYHAMRQTQFVIKVSIMKLLIFEIIKLRYYLLLYKFCGLYSKQNSTISQLCKKKWNYLKNKTYITSSEEKALLKKQLQEINN